MQANKMHLLLTVKYAMKSSDEWTVRHFDTKLFSIFCGLEKYNTFVQN